jgi:hypothetical protein
VRWCIKFLLSFCCGIKVSVCEPGTKRAGAD